MRAEEKCRGRSYGYHIDGCDGKCWPLAEGAKRARRNHIATLPTYVALGAPDGSKLRLVDGRYYRDAGEWSIDAKDGVGGLVASCPDRQSHLHHLDGVPLYLATEADWAKDNGR